MNHLIIEKSDVNIRVWMSKLRIESSGKVLHEFEPRAADLPWVIMLKSVWGCITHEAAFWLSQHGIQVIYTEWNSRQYASLAPLDFQNTAAVQIKQVQCWLDEQVRQNSHSKKAMPAALSVVGGLFVLFFASLYVINSMAAGGFSYVPMVGAVSGHEEELIGVLGWVCGIMMLLGGFMLYRKPKQRITWSAIIIIFSSLSWFGAYGGLFIGFTLGMVGAILAIIWRHTLPSKISALVEKQEARHLASQNMYCHNCGTQMISESKFCNKCGVQLLLDTKSVQP